MNTATSDSCDNGAPVRAVLFDVDGTLVDTNLLHASAWRETFLKFGSDISIEAIHSQIGKGGDNLVPTLLPDAGEALREEMEDYRSGLFERDYLPRGVPFEGVRALFERLTQDGIKIVLASSASAAEVHYHISLIGCEDLVVAFTSSDDVEHSKPCPDIFEAALAKVAPLTANDVVVVGDSPWDVKAAARIGLRAIGVRSGGFEDAELIEAGACALYDGPADLLARYDGSVFAANG
jgi:HAD superfamily hydrolase (TIGR01509 family)